VDVVAEGIERVTQQQALTSLGRTAGQGFLFSRPLTINDALVYLAEHTEIDAVAPLDG
jgi:EAL domain-containing protein (putative c-di-GMP-specific phosphodiesterase class I)